MMKERTLCTAALICGLCLCCLPLWPRPGRAHAVYLFAWPESGRICTESYFSKSSKVRGGQVRMEDSSGSLLASGLTDERGGICFAVPAAAQDLRFIVAAGQGHRAEFLLPAASVAEALGSDTPARAAPAMPEPAMPEPAMPASAMPVSAMTPDAPAVAPDAAVTVPDAPVTTPDAPAAVPDAPVTTPDAPAAVPDAPVATPDAPAAVPDAPAVVPDMPAAVPDAPVVAPDAAAVAPAVPAAAPVVSAAIPPRFTDAEAAAFRALLREELRQELSPLYKALASGGRDTVRDEGPRIRDIVGGLGWIVGLAGLGTFIAARRKKD